jgi:hypothetical protein
MEEGFLVSRSYLALYHTLSPSYRWKLHLRPAHLSIIPDLTLPALPIGVSVDKIFTNYLSYVKTQLQQYIKDQFGEGGALWDTLFPTMDVILTAPNGWEIQQQQRMRAAAQNAGLVSGRLSGKRVHFVSEAEVRNLKWYIRQNSFG